MAEKAKWRVGTKVPRNLYYGDEPIAMLATAELAQALAEKLNNAEYRVTLESALQQEQQKTEWEKRCLAAEQKVKELAEQLRIHNLCAAHHGFPTPECPHCESKILHAHLDHAKEQLQSEQQQRAELLEAKDCIVRAAIYKEPKA